MRPTCLRPLLPAAMAALLGCAASLPATAADYVFQLAGTWSSATMSDSGGSFYAGMPLVETDSADGRMPGLQLLPGDRLTATVTLDHAWSLPQSGLATSPYVSLSMQPFAPRDDGAVYLVRMQETLTFWRDGAVVPTPGFSVFGGGGGDTLSLAGSGTADSPAFSFDKVTLTGTVQRIVDLQSHTYPSVELLAGAGHLEIDANVAAVPEPATWALWLGGLGLCALRRRGRDPGGAQRA